jgi:hypothetical protein
LLSSTQSASQAQEQSSDLLFGLQPAAYRLADPAAEEAMARSLRQ